MKSDESKKRISAPESERMIAFDLNGKSVSVSVVPDALLVDVLRDQLGLTGTKKGCGIGECGVCTVLLNGKAIYSCLTLAVTVDGGKVMTIEGLTAKEGQLDLLQEAFVEEGAVQCGYCTPGMILSVKALLDENPNPTREDVITAISGNLCRCTGYVKIINAGLRAAENRER
jgi:carbon-monoxide dehydrogenase small subunit